MDGRTIYVNEGYRATNQIFTVNVDRGIVGMVTQLKASVSVSRDDDSRVLLITYSDPKTPSTVFTVPSIALIANRTAWRQLTDANPQVRNFALGKEEEITWKSKDGKTVGGVLVKPVGYRAGQRYP